MSSGLKVSLSLVYFDAEPWLCCYAVEPDFAGLLFCLKGMPKKDTAAVRLMQPSSRRSSRSSSSLSARRKYFFVIIAQMLPC